MLKDATLVVGSSSIDMWKSLETDFPGRNVIRRGVSGTKAIDLYNYRHLLIEPFNPKRIIIYEGDNEIGFKWEVPEMMDAMERLFFECALHEARCRNLPGVGEAIPGQG